MFTALINQIAHRGKSSVQSYCVGQIYVTNEIIQFIDRKLININGCEWSFNTIATANFILRHYDTVDQGWANFLYGGPHLKKMLQPRAAHSHYKIGKFTLCVKKHIFILNIVFVFHTLVPWKGVPPGKEPLHQTHRTKRHTFQ